MIKTIIKKLPYDCWTEIISFLENSKDWFSLIRVVRGLFQHVKSVNRKCMRNIAFDGNHVTGFPDHPTVEVLNLSIGSVKAEVNPFHLLEETYKCSSFVKFFETLPSKFPNLEELHIHLSFTSEMGGEKRPYMIRGNDDAVLPSQYVNLYNYFGRSFGLSEFNIQQKFNNLVKLDLVLTRMDVELKSVLFPNLQNLRVMNMGDYYDIDISEGFPSEGTLCDQRKFFLQKECFPRLQSIELHGYIVDFKISEGSFQSQLTELFLGHCIIPERSVKDFKNLKTLGLGCGGNIEFIENLPKLTEFEFFENGWFMNEKLARICEVECGGFPTNIKMIKNLETLTEIEIDNSDCLFGDVWSLIELQDLPKVETVVGKGIGMKILNLPSLKTAKFEYCKSLEIRDDCSLMVLEEFDFSPGNACEKVEMNLASCRGSLKVFRFRRILGRDSMHVDDSFLQFRGFQKLEELEMNYFSLGKQIEVFGDNPNLEKLKLHFRPCGNFNEQQLKIKFHSPVESVRSLEIAGNYDPGDQYKSLIYQSSPVFPDLDEITSINLELNFEFDDTEKRYPGMYRILVSPRGNYGKKSSSCRISNCSVQRIVVGMRRRSQYLAGGGKLLYYYDSEVDSVVIENVEDLKELRLNSIISNLKLVQRKYDNLQNLVLNLIGFVNITDQIVIDGDKFPSLKFLHLRKNNQETERIRNTKEKEELTQGMGNLCLNFIQEIRNVRSLKKIVFQDLSGGGGDFLFCEKIVFDDECEDVMKKVEVKLVTRTKILRIMNLKEYVKEYMFFEFEGFKTVNNE